MEHVKLAREDGGMVIEVEAVPDSTSSEPAVLLPKVSDNESFPQTKENVNVQVRRRPCSSFSLPSSMSRVRAETDREILRKEGNCPRCCLSPEQPLDNKVAPAGSCLSRESQPLANHNGA